jgi:hypothetical protein
MKIINLFTILTFTAIAAPLCAMSEQRWQKNWLRYPDSCITLVHETIKDNAEEIIKRDLISIPEYRASEYRGAYSTQLLDLYKTHNPTSKHYANAKKWILADAVTPPMTLSRAHQLLTNHPITSFNKDNPSDRELLWNIAAAAIVMKHDELKKQANTLMTENEIPLPDSNFMTYLLSYAIITRSEKPSLDTCVDMGAQVEGIKKDSPFTPWLVGDRKERERSGVLFFSNLGKVDYSSPLDCAIRRADKDALSWLKAKQPNLFTNQVWLYYLNRYAQQFADTTADQTTKEESIMAILDANPHLKVDEETANNIYNQCSCGYRGIAIQQRVYPNTSWHYSVVPLLEFLFLSPRQSARPARILTDELDTPIASATSRPTTGENAV